MTSDALKWIAENEPTDHRELWAHFRAWLTEQHPRYPETNAQFHAKHHRSETVGSFLVQFVQAEKLLDTDSEDAALALLDWLDDEGRDG